MTDSKTPREMTNDELIVSVLKAASDWWGGKNIAVLSELIRRFKRLDDGSRWGSS